MHAKNVVLIVNNVQVMHPIVLNVHLFTANNFYINLDSV